MSLIITAPLGSKYNPLGGGKTSLGFNLSGFDPNEILKSFDTIQVKNKGQQFLFSRTGTAYMDYTGAFKTTNTVNNAPAAPGTIAQAAAVAAGDAAFVNGHVVNATPAPAAKKPLLEQPAFILGAAAFIGILGFIVLGKG